MNNASHCGSGKARCGVHVGGCQSHNVHGGAYCGPNGTRYGTPKGSGCDVSNINHPSIYGSKQHGAGSNDIYGSRDINGCEVHGSDWF